MKSTCRDQCHAEAQELLAVHAVGHHRKGIFKSPKVAGATAHVLGERLGMGRGPVGGPGHRSGHRGIQLVQHQLEVQFRNLVVHDKNRLVVVRSPWLLQAQKAIEPNVVPVGDVVGLEQSVEKINQRLARSSVLGAQRLKAVEQFRIKGGHAAKLLANGQWLGL